jgi:hypothetical protein
MIRHGRETMRINDEDQPVINKTEDSYQALYEELKSRPKQKNEEDQLIINDYVSLIPIILVLFVIESYVLIRFTYFIIIISAFMVNASVLAKILLIFLVLLISGFAFHGIAELLMRYQQRWFSKLSFTLKYMTMISLISFWFFRSWDDVNPVLFVMTFLVSASVFVLIQYILIKRIRMRNHTRFQFFKQVIIFSICAFIVIMLSYM